MSYLVLARKWRPQRFDDVVGQQHVTRTLANAIEQDRVAHAFLFTGSRGIGKTSTARILAKALNCERGPTPDPCDRCDRCREITEGHAVDVIEIDGASNRGINEIRELRESVRYAPSRDRYKVYIIDEVHMLTTEAFNALLKTLEEPPAHAVFVFATTEPRKIPVTILSRCQRYDFKRVTTRAIVQRLAEIARAEGLEAEDSALTLIARHARGGMRDALSALDLGIAFCGRDIQARQMAEILGVASREHLLELGAAVLTRDAERALSVLDTIDQYGLDLVHFAAAFLHHLRDLAVAAAVTSPGRVTELSDAELAVVREQLQGVDVQHLQRLFQLFSASLEQIQQFPFPKLLLEMALIRLASLEPVVPVAPLIHKLEALERALAGDRPIPDHVYARYREIIGAPPARARAPRATPAAPTSDDARDPEPDPAPSTPAAPHPTTPAPAASAPAPAALKSAAPAASKPAASAPAAPKASAPAPAAPKPAAPKAFAPAPAAPKPAAPKPAAPTRASQTPAPEVQTPPPPTPEPHPAPPSPPADARSPGASGVNGATALVEPPVAMPARDEQDTRWEALIDAVRRRRPLLAGQLEHCLLIAFDRERLEFWCPQKYVALLDGMDRAQIERSVGEVLDGAQPHIQIHATETAPGVERVSVAARRRAELASEEAQRRGRIERDPALVRAMRIFQVPLEQVSVQVSNPEQERIE